MSLPSFPPLPPEQVALAHTGVSLLLGTCGPDLTPAGARAVGLAVWPDACRVTVFVADATSGDCRPNLAPGSPIALAISRMATHETIQLKGRVVAIQPARPDQRSIVERYITMFSDALADVGVPTRLGRRLACWPATAIDFDITEVFAQTPGPGAGERLPRMERP